VTRAVLRATAAAKINLSLVVGPLRDDGRHDMATVMQRIDLCDRLTLQRSERLEVLGFAEDTLVTAGLERLAAAAGVPAGWRVRLDKEIPLAAGLGGGSADAAAALLLGNRTLESPLPFESLHELAADIGADVPFFLEPGPKLAEGAGERLTRLKLPQDFWVVVALPEGVQKRSTREVYRRFDELGGAPGFDERRARMLEVLASCARPRDLAALPANDLAPASGASDLPARLREAGAFRADVSGAGPAVYGLFHHHCRALAAAAELPAGARRWVVPPVW
jgi:4-diphosphocytidyl-2-C-methyl-D-erythritol kinase